MRELQNGKQAYQATVAMVAIAYGTIAGQKGIIHVNPKSSQESHRELMVSEEDAEKLEKRKLAERKTVSGKRKAAADSQGGEEPKAPVATRIPPEQADQAAMVKHTGGAEPDPILGEQAEAAAEGEEDPDLPPAAPDPAAKPAAAPKPASRPKPAGGQG